MIRIVTLVLMALVGAPTFTARAQELTLLSVNDAGVQGNHHSGHFVSEDFGIPKPWYWWNSTAVSYDGRYIAFTSEASNLVPNDTNGVRDVFVRDRASGKTVRVSVATNGAQANGASGLLLLFSNNLVADAVAISANGRYVVFSSFASNLTSDPDTAGQTDIFIHDRDANQNGVFDQPGGIATWRLSDGGDAQHRYASLSANGSRAAYVSIRPDGWNRIRIVNTSDGSIVYSAGYSSTTHYGKPSLSGNGLYAGIGWITSDGSQSGAVIRNLTGSGPPEVWGAVGPADGWAPLGFSLSYSGQQWVYYTAKPGEGTTPWTHAGFRTGTKADGTWLASTKQVSACWNPQMGPEGRFLSLETIQQFDPNDSDALRDIYLIDCDPDGDGNFTNLWEYTRISRPPSGGPNAASRAGSLAQNAKAVAFESTASNLVPGDSNGRSDVFGTASPVLGEIWVELSVLLDASGSMDAIEYHTVLQAYANAVRDPTIVPRNSQVAINLVLFSDTTQTVIPWTLVNSATTANALGDQLQCYADNEPSGCPRPFNGATDIATGIIGAGLTFVSNDYVGVARIINVTGDGEQNIGTNPVQILRDARDATLDFRVNQINALAYTTDSPDLDLYFTDNLIGGTARNRPAFVLAVENINDVPGAVVQKLRREICLADLNRDGVVNTVDWVLWFNLYNSQDPITDLNGDGVVNSLDFVIWNNAWNAGCG